MVNGEQTAKRERRRPTAKQALVLGVAVVSAAAALFVVTRTEAEPLPIGYDVSAPQCDDALPEPAAFAIVGLNKKLAVYPNPCFGQQVEWAKSSGGYTGVGKIGYYALTGNPIHENVQSWPKDGDNNYGHCDGGQTMACAYEYGRHVATGDLQTIGDHGTFMVWLDVEPGMSWNQNGDEGKYTNRAVLEAMVETLHMNGHDTGIYSDDQSWGEIVGQLPYASSLANKPVWLRKGGNPLQAQAMCRQPAFTGPGGVVTLVQMAGDAFPVDQDLACPM